MTWLYSRRFLLALGLLATFAGCSEGCSQHPDASVPAVQAQGLRPHEPYDPSKAQSLPTSPLTIESGGQTHSFIVELAETERERNIGLMHRNSLAPDRGMIFNFHTEGQELFWMRNTFIPLDMVFIKSSGKIIYIAANTTPHSEEGVGPADPVQAVLELPGGTAARLGIKTGDTVHHKIFSNLGP